MTTKMYVTPSTFDASLISIELGEQKSSTVSNSGKNATIKYHYVAVSYDYPIGKDLTKRGELAIRLVDGRLSRLEDCSKNVIARNTGKKVRIEEFKGMMSLTAQDADARRIMAEIEMKCTELLKAEKSLKKLPGIKSPMYGDVDSDQDLRMYVTMGKSAIKMMKTKVDSNGKRTPVVVSKKVGEPGIFVWDPVSPLCFVGHRVKGTALLVIKHVYVDTSCSKLATMSIALNSFAVSDAEPDGQADMQIEEVTREYIDNPEEVEKLMNNMNNITLSCATPNTLSEKDESVETADGDDEDDSDIVDDSNGDDDDEKNTLSARKLESKPRVAAAKAFK